MKHHHRRRLVLLNIKCLLSPLFLFVFATTHQSLFDSSAIYRSSLTQAYSICIHTSPIIIHIFLHVLSFLLIYFLLCLHVWPFPPFFLAIYFICVSICCMYRERGETLCFLPYDMSTSTHSSFPIKSSSPSHPSTRRL